MFDIWEEGFSEKFRATDILWEISQRNCGADGKECEEDKSEAIIVLD